MIFENNKISLRQFQALLILDIFGTSIITLPRRTAEMAGQNGWLLIAGAAVLVFFYSQVINLLSMEFPDLTFVELSQKIATKPIGILLSAGLGVKLLLTTGLELRVFCEIIKQTMLLKTPIGVTGAFMLFTCAYIAWKGYETRARAAEILLVFMFVPLIIVFAIAAFKTDYSNLMPAFTIAPVDFVKGSVLTAFSFQGIEFLLLVHPFIKRPERVGNALRTAVVVIGVLMLLTTVITMARFGVEDIKVKLWPVLQMMDTIDIPGSFIERQDVIIMRFWVISTFAGVNAGLFLISLIGERMMREKKARKPLLLFFIPVLWLIAMWPDNIAQTYEVLDWCNRYLGCLYFLIVPIILLLLSKIRFGRHREGLGGDAK